MSMNEGLFQLWDLISSGSLTIELAERSDIISVKVSKDKLAIDIKDMDFIRKIAPLIKEIQGDYEGEMQKPREIGLLGIADAILNKKAKMKAQLAVLKGITSDLAKHEKSITVSRDGNPVLKLGHGASSTMLRMLSLNNIEVTDMSTALSLLSEIERA